MPQQALEQPTLPPGWTQQHYDAVFEHRKNRSLKRGSSAVDAHQEAQDHIDSLVKSGQHPPELYVHSHIHGHMAGSPLAGVVHRHPHSHLVGQPHPHPGNHHHSHGTAKEKLTESFKWLMPFKAVFEGIKHLIKGQAITVGKTKNNIPYTHDELLRSARTLTDKPLLINHLEKIEEVQEYLVTNDTKLHPLVKTALEGIVSRSNVGVGMVRDSEFEEESVEYVAEVTDPATQAVVDHKLVLGVSIGAVPRTSGNPPKGIIFTDLSLIVPPEVPADPDATAELMEKLREMLQPTPTNLLQALLEMRLRVAREMIRRINRQLDKQPYTW